jgi:hypothetical protein
LARFISVGPDFAELPPSLTAECTGPIPLPDRDLGIQDVTYLWTTDRKNSAECKGRHKALAETVLAERKAYTKD